MKFLSYKLSILTLLVGMTAPTLSAPKTLDELLQRVKVDQVKDKAENKKREAEFIKARNNQAALLKQAKETLEAEERRGVEIKTAFDANEKQLAELEEKLQMTMGTLGELFGVVKQVAGDTKGVFQNSIVSAEHRGRIDFVDMLGRRKKLPNTNELRELWYALQKEMTESGKVSRFKSKVTGLDGVAVEKDVIRIGTFNLVADGKYLRYFSDVDKLAELGRQPQDRYLSMITDFEGAAGTIVPLGVDPSRGTILSLLVEAPGFWERISQGGVVGWIIVGVLIIGLLITGERLLVLSSVSRKVASQLKDSAIDRGNPLGQIMGIYDENRDKDLESLELKLDEAIMKSSGKLDRGISTIKILASVAPLLGLLGTVTGMIGTFQAITLFGTGDPKLMAGGIAQALVTTMLGLVAAIPLIMLHSVVSSRSKGIVQVLEEQSVGLIAQRAEQEGV